ncbi:MAG TPA: hypothetical protein VII57_09935, partial [Dehalococcoidia bacterium]
MSIEPVEEPVDEPEFSRTTDRTIDATTVATATTIAPARSARIGSAAAGAASGSVLYFMAWTLASEIADHLEDNLRLARVVARDDDLEPVRTFHAFHHVGLERETALLPGANDHRTDDRLERSTALHDAHLHILDAQDL